jgi:hypothetical protein
MGTRVDEYALLLALVFDSEGCMALQSIEQHRTNPRCPCTGCQDGVCEDCPPLDDAYCLACMDAILTELVA